MKVQQTPPPVLPRTGAPAPAPAPAPLPPAAPQDGLDASKAKVDDQEIKSLLKRSVPGAVAGATVLGGAAALLGAQGGIVGGLVGLSAAYSLSAVGCIAGAAGLGYLGFKHAPPDVRKIFYGIGGVVAGGTLGAVAGYYGGGAAGLLAGVHGGLPGAVAGIASAAPVGAVAGLTLAANYQLKNHPEHYPTLTESLKNQHK